MTMNKIMQTLRKKNRSQYTILMFCITLSVLLVTSFSLMYFSPTVQEILPEGGDSRKQANMILAIAVIGCTVFSMYASGIFLKYKSRQFGIFLALGEKKSRLKANLRKELTLITGGCCLAGLVLSLPISFGIWKLFQSFVINTEVMAYRIGAIGFVFGLGFCVVVAFCMFISSSRFIRRTNIIDIIQEQRKTEVVKEIKPWTGKVGVALIIIGMLGGYVVPQIMALQFQKNMPALWNLTYVLVAVGLYLAMLSMIIKSKKGKNPKKYYSRIISTNLMRFTGRQTVRNMCVIALLVIASLYACFYVPALYIGAATADKENPIDYMYYYPESENQIQKDEVYEMADQHNVEITSYQEVKMITLIAGGNVTDLTEDGEYKTSFVDKYNFVSLLSESQYNRLTGQNTSIKSGEYKTIIHSSSAESVWDRFDDLKKVTHPVTEDVKELAYKGTVEYHPFAKREESKYVISDQDFKAFESKLREEDRERYVLFNVKNPDSTYQFAEALKDEFINKSSDEVAVGNYYDRYEKSVAEEKGEAYGDDGSKLELTPENSQLYLDWKYYPTFKVLNNQDMMKNMAVYLLMFIYITIICLAAVAIIAYTRSINVGMDNRQLFQDLKKLGATDHYVIDVIKKQLLKIFMYPVTTGSIIVFVFDAVVKFVNDRTLDQSDLFSLVANLVMILIVVLIMYTIYRRALQKVKRISGISA